MVPPHSANKAPLPPKSHYLSNIVLFYLNLCMPLACRYTEEPGLVPRIQGLPSLLVLRAVLQELRSDGTLARLAAHAPGGAGGAGAGAGGIQRRQFR
jgi:hypothetical protein